MTERLLPSEVRTLCTLLCLAGRPHVVGTEEDTLRLFERGLIDESRDGCTITNKGRDWLKSAGIEVSE